jgi:hypothetical protein
MDPINLSDSDTDDDEKRKLLRRKATLAQLALWKASREDVYLCDSDADSDDASPRGDDCGGVSGHGASSGVSSHGASSGVSSHGASSGGAGGNGSASGNGASTSGVSNGSAAGSHAFGASNPNASSGGTVASVARPSTAGHSDAAIHAALQARFEQAPAGRCDRTCADCTTCWI